MAEYDADYVNGVFMTRDEATARVLEWLNYGALGELKRDAEAAVEFWTQPSLKPIDPWRIELREYVDQIRKERNDGS